MAEIDWAMQENDETAVKEIQKRFKNLGNSSTILQKARMDIPWYSLLLDNKSCQQMKTICVGSGKISVQLKSHRRLCCRNTNLAWSILLRFMFGAGIKHTSRCAKSLNFFKDNGINWWRTPSESPDAKPIKNLWHELKEILRREI